MKEYFIFSIKKDIYKLYKDNPRALFLILNRIYYMKAIDINYGQNLFEQIANFLNKESINNYLEKSLSDRIMYSRTNNEHVINNLYLDEISVLTVKNTHIKIESNKKSSFLELLKKHDDNFFVCDFKEQEYYFLKKKTLKAYIV